jgi:uncharacterized protein
MGPLIGTVAALARFPVKSMGGEALERAELGWTGLAGDRQWAFVARERSSRFPWFTGRKLSRLVCYRAAYVDPDDPKNSPVLVTAPDGGTCLIDEPELAERLERDSGEPISLLRLGRGTYDAMPVSLASTAGHAELEASHGTAIDQRRFRINIVVETDMPMRVWAGRRLAIGSAADGPELVVAAPIERCVMITIDPDTGVRDPWLMRTVALQFANHYGVYANVTRPGALALGDDVRLRD